MKALNIKYSLMFFCFMLLYNTGKAQKFSYLKPQYAVTQHAGSIGYISIGAGYELFKDNSGSLELLYGMVPESKGGPLHILTAKFAYHPFEIKVKNNIKFYPANPGLFFSYHLGEQFDLAFDQDQYGKSYYGWSTALRGHFSLSNEIKINTGKKLKSLSLYSEFNVSDLYLASIFYRNNREWLSPSDITKLGIGVKVGF
ncbi:hypothetical protein WG906_11440 [Pedobacter sp. P351]|uniref:hypothetical protein n=1 Tax=Pedobacter superstes TaxID=3133441 RepID=UPI0030A4057C